MHSVNLLFHVSWMFLRGHFCVDVCVWMFVRGCFDVDAFAVNVASWKILHLLPQFVIVCV